MDLNVKCKDRAPFVDMIEVQIGWHSDGRRKTTRDDNRMSKSCQFDLRLSQPGCQGCKWQIDPDPRDGLNERRIEAVAVAEPVSEFPQCEAAPA